MTRKILFTVAIACGAALAGCDSSPTDTAARPEFDGRTRATTETGPGIGDPCDPETYSGQYRCIPDPNHAGGYIIAY